MKRISKRDWLVKEKKSTGWLEYRCAKLVQLWGSFFFFLFWKDAYQVFLSLALFGLAGSLDGRISSCISESKYTAQWVRLP